MKNYKNDTLLMISGIQHFIYCERQWALIHIEQIWKDNIRTFKGNVFHKKVDNPYITETRDNVIISRYIPLASNKLGIKGIADCVEFHLDKNGIIIQGKKGKYKIIPIEYKVGDVKNHDADKFQLCAQAICLEEMFNTTIDKGYLFYGKSHKKYEICFNETLKENIHKTLDNMRFYFENGITPKPHYKSNCKNCSLYDLCLPKLNNNIDNYIDSYINS